MENVIEENRLKTYKKALDILTNEADKYTYGLCILLQIVCFGEDKYLFDDTPKMFPEFGVYFDDKRIGNPDAKIYNELYQNNKDRWRIKVLTEIISKMESK